LQHSRKVSGYIYNYKPPLINVNIITIAVRGARTDVNGYFEIDVQPYSIRCTFFWFSIPARATNND
jgi:hypothetical protein